MRPPELVEGPHLARQPGQRRAGDPRAPRPAAAPRAAPPSRSRGRRATTAAPAPGVCWGQNRGRAPQAALLAAFQQPQQLDPVRRPAPPRRTLAGRQFRCTLRNRRAVVDPHAAAPDPRTLPAALNTIPTLSSRNDIIGNQSRRRWRIRLVKRTRRSEARLRPAAAAAISRLRDRLQRRIAGLTQAG